jgi:hypothetical protein
MKADWLTRLERDYVHTLLKEAIEHVKMRDMKSCVAFVQHALSSRQKATARSDNKIRTGRISFIAPHA